MMKYAKTKDVQVKSCVILKSWPGIETLTIYQTFSLNQQMFLSKLGCHKHTFAFLELFYL